jgi:CO/xanthine dehydrogenase Mo-binding subunit
MAEALRDAVRDLRAGVGSRGHGRMEIAGGVDPDTGRGVASQHWHQGAAAAEVKLDEETGIVEVRRLHAAVFAGRVVNRPGAELQNEGSMLMGLGTALFEAIEIADGQVTNPNLSDYEIPAFADVPAALTHDLVERDGAEIHGLGETALPPVPAAIGNALGSLGVHVTDLPMTPERVLAALEVAEQTTGV